MIKQLDEAYFNKIYNLQMDEFIQRYVDRIIEHDKLDNLF